MAKQTKAAKAKPIPMRALVRFSCPFGDFAEGDTFKVSTRLGLDAPAWSKYLTGRGFAEPVTKQTNGS